MTQTNKQRIVIWVIFYRATLFALSDIGLNLSQTCCHQCFMCDDIWVASNSEDALLLLSHKFVIEVFVIITFLAGLPISYDLPFLSPLIYNLKGVEENFMIAIEMVSLTSSKEATDIQSPWLAMSSSLSRAKENNRQDTWINFSPLWRKKIEYIHVSKIVNPTIYQMLKGRSRHLENVKPIVWVIHLWIEVKDPFKRK